MKNSKLSLKRLLFVLAMLAVCSGVGATDVEFDVKDGSASQYSDFLGQTVNVTLENRTFTAGEWTGVCFPFSATKEQLDATFGEGKYTIEKFSSFDGTTVNFTIMSTPAVEAGTPYIMKTNTTLSNPTFGGVTFANSLDTWLDISVANDLSFRGFYFKIYDYQLVNGQSSPANAWWISNGTLQSYLANGIPYSESGRLGSGAFFFSSSKGNVALTLNLEQPSNSGSGGGEGGESGGGESGGGESGGESGGDSPAEGSWEYKIANHLQLTDVPTIYLTIPDVTDLDADLKKDKSTTPWVAEYHQATIQVVDNSEEGSLQHLESFVDAGLQIKVRGNSTSDPSKRPYRLKFDKDEKDPLTGEKTGVTHKHDLLGYGYKKRNWTLLANTFDATMVRNALTYHLNKAIGMDFCPGYKFVDLVINGDYRGTYQVSDHIEADKKRVNVDEDTGWMFEFARADMTEEPKFTDPLPGSIKNPDFDDLTEAEQTALKSEMQTWLNAWGAKFTSNSFASNSTGWRSVNDENSLVNFYIGINITGDYDGFMTVKTYKGDDGKMHYGPIWDKDLAFGNYSLDDGKTLVENQPNGNFRYYVKGDGNCLYKDPAFITRVKNRLDELVTNGLIDNLCNKVDELVALTAQTRTKNYERWAISGSTTLNNVGLYHEWPIEEFSKYTDQLKNYLRAHIVWFQEQVNARYAEVVESAGSLTYDPTSQGEWDNGHTYTNLYSYNNSNRDLTVSPIEKIVGTKWRTIYLPFNYSETQMTSLVGEYELREFTGVSGSTFRFTIPASKDINSCVPYLIKLKNESASTLTMLDFGKVFFSFDSEAAKDFSYGDYAVTGIMHALQLRQDGSQYVIGNDNSLVQLPAGEYVDGVHNRANVFNGFQAYFVVPKGVAPDIYIEPVEPVVRTQLADVPTIYIDTQAGAAIQPSTGEYVPAAIEVLDKNNMIGGGFTETSSYLEVRGRGKTEWAVKDGKKSYRLKFAKDEKDADGNVTTSHKHDLTNGGYAKRNWILLANAADESLVRNALADELGQAMGFAFTPKYQHVDLYINNVYQGTYLATDHVEADDENGESKRVPVDEKQGWLLDMTNQDGIATGDVYVEGGESYPYINIKNPEPGNKTGTEEEIKTKVKTFFDTLWAADDGTRLDKESFVNWYIATEILGNASSLTGIYAYKENDDAELKFGPLWGNELALGNSLAYDAMVYESADASAWKSKLTALWQQNWFKNAVKTRWAELYKSGVNDLKATMLTKFADLQTAVGQSHDGAKAGEITEIETYLGQRFEYLNTKFAELTQTTALIGDVNGDGKVSVIDVALIRNNILGKSSPLFDKTAADINGDGRISVIDLGRVINIILKR